MQMDENCAVRFKDHPLGAAFDGLLKEDEVAAEDDVLSCKKPADYNICNPTPFFCSPNRPVCRCPKYADIMIAKLRLN